MEREVGDMGKWMWGHGHGTCRDTGTQRWGRGQESGDMGTQRHEGGGVGDVGRGLVGTLGHGDTEMGGEVRKVGM